jgi:hypothetical protein
MNDVQKRASVGKRDMRANDDSKQFYERLDILASQVTSSSRATKALQ